MNKKFSIICPTFNRPHMINRAIMAILDQDYDNWELIIQNGGDTIKNIVPKDPRIKLFEEKDNGITDAMNKGMAKATGDIFTWINDDDEMNQETLKWVDENLEKEWGYGIIMMTDGTRSFEWGDVGTNATFTNLVEGNFVPQPSVFWTRKAYETVGGMDESEDLTSDYEYWMRLWKAFEPQKFQRLMATYHLHPGQITQTQTEEQMRQARETAKKYR